MESSEIKSLVTVSQRSKFHLSRHKSWSGALIVLTILTLVVLTFVQNNNYKKVSLFAADAEYDTSVGDMSKWNPTMDPNPKPVCDNYSYNVIVLFDRSPRYLAELGDSVDEFKSAVKSMFDRLAILAKNRNGKARVILGAYATYNVWQNIPKDRLSNTNWDDTKEKAWRDSIDITNNANLETLKKNFDNIYTTDEVVEGNSFNAEMYKTANLGYTGGEPGRDFWEKDYPDKNDPRNNGWGFDNLDDALIQSAREISRWGSNTTADPTSGNMDMVLALTSGEPNVNNGPNLFPSKSGLTTAPPNNYWNSLSGSPWYDYYSGSDDIFRAAGIVSALRKGSALPKPYKDPNEGTSLQVSDSVPAFDGPRNPVRVFGHAVIPDTVYNITQYPVNPFQGLARNPFLHMGQLFGTEYQDYGIYNPPGSWHRHWDKTFGEIKKEEILSDLSLFMKDTGCTPPMKNINPSVSVTPLNGQPNIIEGDSNGGVVTAVVTNNGDVPLENVEIWVDGKLVNNEVYYQEEVTTCILTWCASSHVYKTEVFGFKYADGRKIDTKKKLEVGESVVVSYNVVAPLGAKSSDFPVQVWGHAIYDPTSQQPPAPSGDINSTFGQNNGYVRSSLDVGFTITRRTLPA